MIRVATDGVKEIKLGNGTWARVGHWVQLGGVRHEASKPITDSEWRKQPNSVQPTLVGLPPRKDGRKPRKRGTVRGGGAVCIQTINTDGTMLVLTLGGRRELAEAVSVTAWLGTHRPLSAKEQKAVSKDRN